MTGPCAKTLVRCTIVASSGRRWVGENICANPQPTCPRAPGEGYEKCRTVCVQIGHAEVVAAILAGPEAAGGVAYLEGHTYACDSCKAALALIGVTDVRIEAPPRTNADQPADGGADATGAPPARLLKPEASSSPAASPPPETPAREERAQRIAFAFDVFRAEAEKGCDPQRLGAVREIERLAEAITTPEDFGAAPPPRKGALVEELPEEIEDAIGDAVLAASALGAKPGDLAALDESNRADDALRAAILRSLVESASRGGR